MIEVRSKEDLEISIQEIKVINTKNNSNDSQINSNSKPKKKKKKKNKDKSTGMASENQLNLINKIIDSVSQTIKQL